MGLGQKFLTHAGSFLVAWVGLGLENFPQNSKIFNLYSLWIKKILMEWCQKIPDSKIGWPLIYYK